MMIKLPWQKTENRNFTDLITQAILMQATGEAALSGALEIATGYVGRAFASAEAKGSHAGLFDAIVLTELGRDLIEKGESAWRIYPGRMEHLLHFDVMSDGAYDAGTGAKIPAAEILHVRYHTDINTLRGISPLSKAGGLNTLLTRMEQAMGFEAGSTVGYILPVPSGSDVSTLKADIQKMKGQIAVVETTAGGWDAGRANAPRRDYAAQRLGANIPDTSIQLYKYATDLALAACGVPPELADSKTDGTGQRESWRRFMFGTLVPLARLISAYAKRKGLDVQLNFDDLMASDIAGRARAFGSLVQGGMDIEDAAILTGLVTQD